MTHPDPEIEAFNRRVMDKVAQVSRDMGLVPDRSGLVAPGAPAIYVLTVQPHYFDEVVAPRLFADPAKASRAYAAETAKQPVRTLVSGSLSFDPTTSSEAHAFFGEEADALIVRIAAVPRP